MDDIKQLINSYDNTIKINYSCPLCQLDVREIVHVGDRHNLGITTVICGNCSMIYQNPRPTDDWYSEFYKRFFWNLYGESDVSSEQVASARRYRQIGKALFCQLSNNPSHILDFGSGSGGAFLGLREVFQSAEFKGLDPSIDSVEMCKREFGFDVCKVDFDQFVLPDDFTNAFDLITMVHVLEHVTDPLKILGKAVEGLKDGGYIYVEVPNMTSSFWKGEGFLHVAHPLGFTPFTLDLAVRICRLSPVKTYNGLVEEWPWAVGILAKKNNKGEEGDNVVVNVGSRQLARVKKGVIGKTSQAGLSVRRKRWKLLRKVLGLS